jgi:hypothetical protein
MKALIDADVISYECSAVGQKKDEQGELIIHPFDFVAEVADNRIRTIVEETWSDEYELFFTSDPKLIAVHNRLSEEKLEYVPNYRIGLAKTKPYKGQRMAEKPYHFHNLRAYLLSSHPYSLANGCEADDLICINLNDDSVACSRDKDLRQSPGRHYAWPCGELRGWGPRVVDEQGTLSLDGKGNPRGTGGLFLAYQLIVGDPVDNIPGLPRFGKKRAYELLEGLSAEEAYKRVRDKYLEITSEEYFEEQLNLLYILRTKEELERWVDHKES